MDRGCGKGAAERKKVAKKKRAKENKQKFVIIHCLSGFMPAKSCWVAHLALQKAVEGAIDRKSIRRTLSEKELSKTTP